VEVGERLTAFATVDRLADAVEVENIPRRDRLGGRRTVPLVAESEPAPPLRLGSAARRCEKDPGGERGHDESTRARHARIIADRARERNDAPASRASSSRAGAA